MPISSYVASRAPPTRRSPSEIPYKAGEGMRWVDEFWEAMKPSIGKQGLRELPRDG